MNLKTMRILLISLLFAILMPCYSQKHLQEDLARLEKITHQQKERKAYSLEKNAHGFFQLVVGGLFIVYKNFVSSQDAGNCPYSPSCSVYMKNAIEKKGGLQGLLDGIDRFMRCNGAHTNQYFFDREKRKLIDPVDY
jgi:putative component of membrane protein insertase Oxa1/YidC/SpoIIIJ protein YidD